MPIIKQNTDMILIYTLFFANDRTQILNFVYFSTAYSLDFLYQCILKIYSTLFTILYMELICQPILNKQFSYFFIKAVIHI